MFSSWYYNKLHTVEIHPPSKKLDYICIRIVNVDLTSKNRFARGNKFKELTGLKCQAVLYYKSKISSIVKKTTH